MLKFNYKKILILLTFLFLSTVVFSSDYDIEKYVTNIKVQESGIFDITEQMDVKFHQKRHGIIREIPLFYNNRIAKIDRSHFVMENHPFSLSRENNVLSIKIGDPDKYANERESYIFSYTFDTFDDKDSTKDVINYNILGHFHDAGIKNFSATISLPKEINANDIELYSGPMGEEANALNVQYEYDDQKREVTIFAQDIEPKNGITFRIELEEGYFVGATVPEKLSIASIITFSILILLFTLIVWALFGRDKKIIFIPEIHPPKDMNPLQMGYLIDQHLSNEDLTSMFYYWADKGKVEITHKGEDDFSIRKIEELDKNEDEDSKLLFSTFFDYFSEDGQEITSKYISEVKEVEKLKKLALAIEHVKRKVSHKYSGKQSLHNIIPSIFLGLTFAFNLFLFFTITYFMYFAAMTDGAYTFTYEISDTIVFGSNTFPIIMFIIARNHRKNKIKNKMKSTTNTMIASLIVMTFYVASMVFISITDYSDFYSAAEAITFFIIFSIITSITYFVIASINKRSKYYNKQLAVILGLKTFIEKVEIDELKLLIDEDPDYYYKTLSYSIVLGLEEVWARKFAGLNVNIPSWYNSSTSDGFSSSAFSKTFSSMSSSLSSSLVSASSASTGGSGSSSSGGGGGGGGSSSW